MDFQMWDVNLWCFEGIELKCWLCNNKFQSSLGILGVFCLLAFNLSGCDGFGQAPNDSAPTSSASATDTPVLPTTPPQPSPSSAEDRAAASSYRQAGLDLRNQARYGEAIANLQQAVKLDPSNLSGHVLLGWTLHLAGQETEAAVVLEKAQARWPDNVPVLNALGIVYLVSGDLAAAVQIHQQAVALEPDNEIGYYNLSLAYQRLQRFGKAITNAKRAAELEPANPHPQLAMAIAHWSNDEPTLARSAYQQAISLDPGYLDADFLEHLTLAGFSPEQIQQTNRIRQSVIE